MFDWFSGGLTAKKNEEKLVLILDRTVQNSQALVRLEKILSALTDAVASLTEAVANLQTGAGSKYQELLQQIADLKAADEAEDAAYQEQIAALQQTVENMQAEENSAVQGITDAVNAIKSAGDSVPPDQAPDSPPNPDDPHVEHF